MELRSVHGTDAELTEEREFLEESKLGDFSKGSSYIEFWFGLYCRHHGIQIRYHVQGPGNTTFDFALYPDGAEVFMELDGPRHFINCGTTRGFRRVYESDKRKDAWVMETHRRLVRVPSYFHGRPPPYERAQWFRVVEEILLAVLGLIAESPEAKVLHVCQDLYTRRGEVYVLDLSATQISQQDVTEEGTEVEELDESEWEREGEREAHFHYVFPDTLTA
ncbi:hypothetical protein KIPB_011145, partial [Kipferlia bialata]|eukprot:g11145.t1